MRNWLRAALGIGGALLAAPLVAVALRLLGSDDVDRGHATALVAVFVVQAGSVSAMNWVGLWSRDRGTRRIQPRLTVRTRVLSGLVLLGLSLSAPGLGEGVAQAGPVVSGRAAVCDQASLVADFAARDQLPEASTPVDEWYTRNWNQGWGPRAAAYPAVTPPSGCDPVEWQRET